MQKEYERYSELWENEIIWKEKIIILSQEVNNADENLKNQEKVYGIALQELAKIEMEVIDIRNKIAKIKSNNIDSVYLSNPFKDLDELNILSNKFKSRY